MTSRSVASAAVLAIQTMLAVTAEPPRKTGVPLAIALTFHGRQSEKAVRAMRQEVEHLMARTSIPVRWHVRQAEQRLDVEGRLVLVDLLHDCEAGVPLGWSNRTGPLAWDDVTDGQLLPHITVDCRRVATFIERNLCFRPRDQAPAIYGKALARVLAHELYHYLTQTTHHRNHSAIFQSGIDSFALTSDELDFRPEEISTLDQAAENF